VHTLDRPVHVIGNGGEEALSVARLEMCEELAYPIVRQVHGNTTSKGRSQRPRGSLIVSDG